MPNILITPKGTPPLHFPLAFIPHSPLPPSLGEVRAKAPGISLAFPSRCWEGCWSANHSHPTVRSRGSIKGEPWLRTLLSKSFPASLNQGPADVNPSHLDLWEHSSHSPVWDHTPSPPFPITPHQKPCSPDQLAVLQPGLNSCAPSRFYNFLLEEKASLPS